MFIKCLLNSQLSFFEYFNLFFIGNLNSEKVIKIIFLNKRVIV